MKFVLISDYLAGEVLGGCEINNEELAEALRLKGHSVIEKRCSHMISEHIAENRDCCFIVSNFIDLLDEVKEALLVVRYVIYEHDHKYLRRRNPALFEDFKAPPEELVNLDFYQNAMAVLCQTDFHAGIVRLNTGLENITTVGGNLWSEGSLEKMQECLEKEKSNRYSILNSTIFHKGTADAIRLCDVKGWAYDLVSSADHHDFLGRLSQNQNFVFLPQTPETLSRVVCEARMMGMKVVTNNLVGATKEEWFPLKGAELITYMRDKRQEIAATIERIFGL